MDNTLAEWLRVMNSLAKTYQQLPGKAATIAVNFSKERFRAQNWVDETTKPWKKRKKIKGSKRQNTRATLVKTGTLKRDVQKIYVGPTSAIVGTSKITAKYARAHNEGYSGTVTVKAHKRQRFRTVSETYTTKKGNQRKRKRKEVDTARGAYNVKSHKRKVTLAQRRFLGPSKIMDQQIQRMMAAEYLKAIRNA